MTIMVAIALNHNKRRSQDYLFSTETLPALGFSCMYTLKCSWSRKTVAIYGGYVDYLYVPSKANYSVIIDNNFTNTGLVTGACLTWDRDH